MRNTLIFIFIFTLTFVNAQTKKLAILDFDVLCSYVENDFYGKLASSIMTTDLQSNISSTEIMFYERELLDKILDEQDLQKSKDFDEKTAVDFGKLHGVDYVLYGEIFFLRKNEDIKCNVSAYLVNVETSQILLTGRGSGDSLDISQIIENLAKKFVKGLEEL